MGHCGLGRLRRRKMLPLPWLVLVVAHLVFPQPVPPNCCETKTVGGVSYTFVREDTTAISYSCLSPCVYERDDQPGTGFCFAQGDQQVVCGDSTQGGGEGSPGCGSSLPTVPLPGTSSLLKIRYNDPNLGKVVRRFLLFLPSSYN